MASSTVIRKYSETTGSCAASSMPTKPCLKRRCSVPEKPGAAPGSNSSSSSDLGSCDSLDSSGIFGSSFGSRKSVSFADSVGEDLCRVKLFEKELHEFSLDLIDPLWTWRRKRTIGDWILGEDFFECDLDGVEEDDRGDEDDDDDEDDFFYGNDFMHQVIPEEDEEEEDDEDDVLMMIAGASVDESADDDESDCVIVSTFLNPGDFPDFDSALTARGVSLEAVEVIPDQRLISGTVLITSSADEGETSLVTVTYSFDNWRTTSNASSSASASTSADPRFRRFDFAVPAAEMRVGDDLELVVNKMSSSSPPVTDDNDGARYRFICKSKSKFSPGKKLW